MCLILEETAKNKAIVLLFIMTNPNDVNYPTQESRLFEPALWDYGTFRPP